MSHDHLLAKVALAVASHSISTRWQIGAVFSHNGIILATGHNHMPLTSPTAICEVCIDGIESSHDDIIHAEMSALSNLLRQGLSPLGLTLTITHAPCFHCAKVISVLGLHEVLYITPFSTTDGLDYLRRYRVPVRQLTL